MTEIMPHPIDVTDPAEIAAGIAAGWAEPYEPHEIDFTPRVAAAVHSYNVVAGRPVNPHARTGRIGRRLGLWGENRTADAAVIVDGDVLLILRDEDNPTWALPGGFVDDGEQAYDAALRELGEETALWLPAGAGEILGHWYADGDPRNTDNAWIVTTLVAITLDERPGVIAGDEVLETRWWPLRGGVDELQQRLQDATGTGLYSPHPPLLRRVAQLVDGGSRR